MDVFSGVFRSLVAYFNLQPPSSALVAVAKDVRQL